MSEQNQSQQREIRIGSKTQPTHLLRRFGRTMYSRTSSFALDWHDPLSLRDMVGDRTAREVNAERRARTAGRSSAGATVRGRPPASVYQCPSGQCRRQGGQRSGGTRFATCSQALSYGRRGTWCATHVCPRRPCCIMGANADERGDRHRQRSVSLTRCSSSAISTT